jgi:hypothetical protein
MNDFDPGKGWVNQQFHSLDDEVPRGTVAFREEDGSWSYWVREAPMPPLPTAPYTVIRVTWRRDFPLPGGVGPTSDRVLDSIGNWQPITPGGTYRPASLQRDITGFEVLSEPRAVTAKAVLDEVAGWIETTEAYDEVAREFGVES